MRLKPVLVSLRMHFIMLSRKRVVLLLITIIPVLFIMMVQLTSSEREVWFKIGISESDKMIQSSEMHVSLLFVTLATIGFLASFLSLNLVQEFGHVNHRLIICGYHTSEIIFSVFSVMVAMILVMVVCLGIALQAFFAPLRTGYMMLGMLFAGITYGCYGLMIGTILKGQLEGVLAVVLLANIDAGWIQNPLFFNEARNKIIIELLPAYYPSQVAMAAAFSDFPLRGPIISSLIYMGIFLAFSLGFSYLKMRIHAQVQQFPKQ